MASLQGACRGRAKRCRYRYRCRCQPARKPPFVGVAFGPLPSFVGPPFVPRGRHPCTAGQRRRPCSPAQARGRAPRPDAAARPTPPRLACASPAREWGLRSRTPPPTCNCLALACWHTHPLVEQVVRACGRRPHSRDGNAKPTRAGVGRAAVCRDHARPRAWAGERLPAPPATAQVAACRRRHAPTPAGRIAAGGDFWGTPRVAADPALRPHPQAQGSPNPSRWNSARADSPRRCATNSVARAACALPATTLAW